MEGFDPIGRERKFYRNDVGQEMLAIDASGELPSGQTFGNLNELNPLLLEHKSQFARYLTEKMLTYALGRQLHFAERARVRKILVELEKRGNILQDLVELVVMSDSFQTIGMSKDETREIARN